MSGIYPLSNPACMYWALAWLKQGIVSAEGQSQDLDQHSRTRCVLDQGIPTNPVIALAF